MFPTKNNVGLVLGDPRTQKSARAQAARGCAARAWIFATFHNLGSHECSTILGMRARRRRLTTLAEITLREHEVRCRGGEIIPATHFPEETSRRILVRTSALPRHTWIQTSCRAHSHANRTDPSFFQGASSTKDVESMDLPFIRL